MYSEKTPQKYRDGLSLRVLRGDPQVLLSPKHAPSKVHCPKFYIIKALYFIALWSQFQANLPVSQSVELEESCWGLIMQR